MTRDEFKSLLTTIYDFFNLKTLPSSTQIDMWADDVKGVPAENRDAIFRQIKANETKPSNIPHAIKIANSLLPKPGVFIEYDEYDDPRYPTQNLWSAFYLLRDQGEEAFKKYCKQNRMPLQDIERIRNKYNMAYTETTYKKFTNTIGEK